MKKLIGLVLSLALVAFVPSKLLAGSLVVQTCGTNPQTYAPGATRLNTVDVNGNMCTNGAAGGPTNVLSKSGVYTSSGTDQMALAVSTNTQLTVPAGTTCAQITVEGASIRRTSDTTSATTTNGTLIPAGSAWQDCGPLAAYKFTAVSGSPTLDVEYFK